MGVAIDRLTEEQAQVPGLVGRRHLIRAASSGEQCSSLSESSASRTTASSSSTSASLPLEEVDVACRTAAEVADAIRTMVVRGAPAIGIAAAYGIRARRRARRGSRRGRARCSARRGRRRSTSAGRSTRCAADPSREHARAIHRDEVERCRAMSAHAAALLAPGTRALTHCNAGGLATGGYGSAVGALLAAWERGLLDARLGRRDAAAAPGRAADGVGARDGGHPARRDRRLGRRVADGCRRGRRRLHRRRPDRRERRHREQDRHVRSRRARPATTTIPFYIVAPSSTVDHATASGAEIPIEERDPAEVTARFAGAESGVRRHARPTLITAIVTEHGVHAAAVRRVARAARWSRREGAPARRRVRDAASAADRRAAEAAAARSAGGRWSTGSSTRSRRPARSTRFTSSRTRSTIARVRELGRRPRA